MNSNLFIICGAKETYCSKLVYFKARIVSKGKYGKKRIKRISEPNTDNKSA